MTLDEDAVILAQMGRMPRSPYRIALRCSHGFPLVIVSPSILEDGERFPTCAWLTCPWLSAEASRRESAGEMTDWAKRAAGDEPLSRALIGADVELRCFRAAEGAGVDACGSAGVAGAGSPGSIKCLHARIAAALVGIDDPIGSEILRDLGDACDDRRCENLVTRSAHV